MRSTNSSTPALVGSLAIASIIVAAGYVITQSKPSSTASLGNTNSSSQATLKNTASQTGNIAVDSTNAATKSVSTTNTPSMPSSGYKDGDYTSSASYDVPGGNTNRISLSLKVANGIITSASTKSAYSDGESGVYIDAFEGDIKSAIVGKSLKGLSLSRIGGASLTTRGFDNALSTIANQAKA